MVDIFSIIGETIPIYLIFDNNAEDDFQQKNECYGYCVLDYLFIPQAVDRIGRGGFVNKKRDGP